MQSNYRSVIAWFRSRFQKHDTELARRRDKLLDGLSHKSGSPNASSRNHTAAVASTAVSAAHSAEAPPNDSSTELAFVLGVKKGLSSRSRADTVNSVETLREEYQYEPSLEEERLLQEAKAIQREKDNSRLRQSIVLRFNKLGLTLPNEKKVLQDVSGRLAPARLTAIMGPSGCGKTTFLNVLSGRAKYGSRVGEILINNALDNVGKYKKVIGFVPQDDTMHTDLTVLEIVSMSAQTRLPKFMSNFDKDVLVEETLILLGLSGLRYQRIGDVTRRGVSGGQRKRVSIAMELVAEPILLALDEPSSGLDASSALELVDALRKLSREGLTVAAVIHQPRYEVFQAFDNVLLLGPGGRSVYLGPTNEVQQYFESCGFVCPPHVNPADYFLDVISGEVDTIPHVPDDIKELCFSKSLSGALVLKEKANARAGDECVVDYLRTGQFMDNGSFEHGRWLQDMWEVRQNVDPWSESVRDDEEPIIPARKPVKVRRLGTRTDFASSLLLCAICPWALWYMMYGMQWSFVSMRRPPLRSRYGAMYGIALCMVLASVIMMSGSESALVGVFGAMMLAFALALGTAITFFFYRSVLLGTREQATFLGNFILGVISGPAVFVAVWFVGSRKSKSALWSGLFFTGLIAGSYWYLFSLVLGTPLNTWVSFVLFTVLYSTFAALLVLFTRYHRLPHFERSTAGPVRQIVLYTQRALSQHATNWQGIVFDIGLMFLSGSFLGVIFYGRHYEGTLLSPWRVELGQDVKCPKLLEQLFPPLCGLALLPLDDPIPAMASLSGLSVSMAAVASSMRIFGDEKEVFVRESGVGMSTEAYYIGKTLGHIPTTLLAPFVFLFTFGALADVRGSWWDHYLLLVLIYTISSGMAYLVSVITRRNLSQLVGVIGVLITMMFSGANPTLGQLDNNALLPHVLYYPSYLSYLRWTQELFYLIEIKAYSPIGIPTMKALYQYSLSDWDQAWCFAIGIALVFRLMAYFALVTKEQ